MVNFVPPSFDYNCRELYDLDESFNAGVHLCADIIVKAFNYKLFIW